MAKAEMEKTLRKEEEAKKQQEIRSIKRKPDVPKANKRDFDEENVRMGITSELDLLIGEGKEKYDFAKTKKEKGMIEYTSSLGEVKKQRQERYLTIQGLLSHPYFISINEADIAIIIDEFEKLMQPS